MTDRAALLRQRTLRKDTGEAHICWRPVEGQQRCGWRGRRVAGRFLLLLLQQNVSYSWRVNYAVSQCSVPLRLLNKICYVTLFFRGKTGQSLTVLEASDRPPFSR